jgi:hypothetical protein
MLRDGGVYDGGAYDGRELGRLLGRLLGRALGRSDGDFVMRLTDFQSVSLVVSTAQSVSLERTYPQPLAARKRVGGRRWRRPGPPTLGGQFAALPCCEPPFCRL